MYLVMRRKSRLDDYMMRRQPDTYPTEQTDLDSLIDFATERARETEPVATGFSTKSATPGKYWRSLSSASAPARSDPRNCGGEPTTMALKKIVRQAFATIYE